MTRTVYLVESYNDGWQVTMIDRNFATAVSVHRSEGAARKEAERLQKAEDKNAH